MKLTGVAYVPPVVLTESNKNVKTKKKKKKMDWDPKQRLLNPGEDNKGIWDE